MTEPRTYHRRAQEITAMQWDGTEESAQAICDWINSESRAPRPTEGQVVYSIGDAARLCLVFPAESWFLGVGWWVYRCVGTYDYATDAWFTVNYIVTPRAVHTTTTSPSIDVTPATAHSADGASSSSRSASNPDVTSALVAETTT